MANLWLSNFVGIIYMYFLQEYLGPWRLFDNVEVPWEMSVETRHSLFLIPIVNPQAVENNQSI